MPREYREWEIAQGIPAYDAYMERRRRETRRQEAQNMVADLQAGDSDGFDYEVLVGKHRGRVDRINRQITAEPLILNLPPNQQAAEEAESS